jgi:Flp pilus assembly pilin Flp
MRNALKQIWIEEEGVLSFEWTLLVTLLTIGIVSGLSAARDAIIDELGDMAQTMQAVDQSYHIGFPLAASVHVVAGSAAADTTYADALFFEDCDRPLGVLPGPALGQGIIDDFPE